MPDEKDLISRLISNDEPAFKELVNSFKDRVFNTAMGMLRNAEDAEDIAQEVFIEVFNSVSGFRGDSSLSTWIYRITVTKSLDFIRRKKRKKRFAFITSIFGAGDEAVNEPKDFFHPGVETENRELSAELFKAIEKLPQNQKIAFTLNKLEDLSHKEMSEIMNVSVPAIESLLHRAKINLRRLLTDYYNET